MTTSDMPNPTPVDAKSTKTAPRRALLPLSLFDDPSSG
eukprot:CAMPEP_0194156272 /NCGR_PEP_ID=MMETSP0152-20130528/67693_1 /TAXON_ID=1049557 /ORGANISM="Thalassiothrix antarctica, Strain L6-D1" /LENGTH=37 /DNA_ID= /DNA_START= /DNA_END= /DNA_ORIENTATION=